MAVVVPARAALAGNPSDLHGGAVLAIPVRSFGATVTVSDAPVDLPLLRAALYRVVAEDTGLDWSTKIPRSVGLAGSSALVIAALRAVRDFPDPLELAELALAVERDDLAIVAGLQDRAVQAYNEPVLVDVAGPRPLVRVLRSPNPLRFVVVWDEGAGGDSGVYHGDRAEPDADGMRDLADIARHAANAFAAGDARDLANAMEISARLRNEVAPLPMPHQNFAAKVRACGLKPNSAGSGGAVVAVLPNEEALDALRAEGLQFVVEDYSAGLVI